jgi:RNA polymerase sigma-70 factor, ECF subfamily
MLDGWDDHEQALARRAVDDPDAFQQLYRRYVRRVYGYVAARIANPGDAEDVVSEIFLRVVKRLDQLRNQQHLSFVAWLFAIARNAVSDYYRRDGHANRLVPLDATPLAAADSPLDHAIIADEDAAPLRALIRALPERQREVITLRYYGELRNREIADVLGIGEKTVSAYISRALRDLQADYTALKVQDEPKAVDDEP